MTRAGRGGEAGYAMAALIAAAAVLVIGLAAAAPSWRYVVKNDREEELIFRGGQIADAIQRYQKRNAGALPATLEVLVTGRFLRKAYRDPMTPKGEWRFIRQGEAASVGVPGRPGTPAPTTTRPGAPGGPGRTVGGFVGVASLSRDKGLRLFNGKEKYDEWFFVAGQPRLVGKTPRVPGAGSSPSPRLPPVPGPSPAPGATTSRSEG
jgi:type II secretory pathway pseudopilin PulG